MKIIIGLFMWLLFCSPVLAEEMVIVPSESAGPVTANTSEADLIALLGKEQVKREKIPLPEDDEMEVTVLFPGNSEKELQVVWDKPFVKPIAVNIIGSAWKTPEGVALGMSLKDLEKVNQSSFKLAGYEWDYAGVVTSYGKGQLSKYAKTLHLRFNDDDASKRVSDAEYASVMGDSDFSSGNKVMQKMNPAVKEMRITFSKPESTESGYIPRVDGEWKIVSGVCGKVCTMDNAQISKYKGKMVQIYGGSYLSPFIKLDSCGLTMSYEIKPLAEWLDSEPYASPLNLKAKNIAVHTFSCPKDSAEFITLDDDKTAVIAWEGVYFKLQLQ
ncbi:hypothetical protein [Budvicia aquatica]|nr:hypothetical protein [Budvicia aquatica]PHI30890.1 hypothetical protein CRN84_16870 [Budvicia aquatica]